MIFADPFGFSWQALGADRAVGNGGTSLQPSSNGAGERRCRAGRQWAEMVLTAQCPVPWVSHSYKQILACFSITQHIPAAGALLVLQRSAAVCEASCLHSAHTVPTASFIFTFLFSV